jgi:predicted Holliday junction resolvase-like endonuclease
MQNVLVGFVIIFLLLIIALLAIAAIYLFLEMRKSQSKVEDVIKSYEGQLRDSKIKQKYEIEKARHQSVDISRRTLKGQIAEQFAPFLQGFPYLPSDSHFIGAPIDYLVFNGYTEFKDNHGSNDNFELVILDIKYNTAQLTEGQEQIAKAIKAGKVRFETVRVLPNGKIEVDSWDSQKKNDVPSVTELNPPQKSSEWQRNLDEFLKKYPKAYEPWDEMDDRLLKEKYLAGMKINDIALLLKRNPYKIRSRIQKNGLVKNA